MIAKILIVAVILGLVYFLFIKKLTKNRPKNSGDDFVECEKCGTFVGLNETILKDGKYFCCECLK